MPMNVHTPRLNQNPVLKGMFLGMSNNEFVATKVLPELPMELRGQTIPRVGDEQFKKHELKRAPGTAYKQITLDIDGVVVEVEQSAVEVLIPEEWLDEASRESKTMDIKGKHLDLAKLAMKTAHTALLTAYEIEVGELLGQASTYASGHTLALTGTDVWTDDGSDAYAHIEQAVAAIEDSTGKTPNQLNLSAAGYRALRNNKAILDRLSANDRKHVTMDILKDLLEIPNINVGKARWKSIDGSWNPIWGNSASLSFAGNANATTEGFDLGQPSFGYTNTLKNAEYKKPVYRETVESHVFKIKLERKAQILTKSAGFLIANVA